MKNYSYIFSAFGWCGFIICLVIIILLNKCNSTTTNPQIIKEQTIVNNYYDSTSKIVIEKNNIPGKPIAVLVPQNVDTQKILSLYYSKQPYQRVFENDTIRAVLNDTICQNKFLTPGKFTYQWLKPLKTVTSTTVTITNETKKQIQFLVGAHADFTKNYFTDWGPDFYLQLKRGHLGGLGYNVNQQAISVKAAINLNDVFRSENK